MEQDLPTGDDARAAQVFNGHRRLLTSVAYRVLGRWSDAEDVVQDAWLRWSGSDYTSVQDPKAFLVTVTTRLAIDQLRKAQTRKESYVGPWLPEPVLTRDGADTAPDTADRVVLDDTVSLAMLLVMETLSPLERAVFVLREAFDYSFAEIAAMLDRTEAAVRQLLVRARNHVQDKRPRYPLDDVKRQSIAERFLSACVGGDIAPLLELLSPEITVISDGGGVVTAATRPVVGLDNVSRFLLGITQKYAKYVEKGMDIRVEIAPVGVNGDPAVIAFADDKVLYVYTLDMDEDGRIRTVFAMANPEKLSGVRALEGDAG
ncbi:RNA polymerase sigma factor SigJ [Catenulispora pinisilvae]|uniref:RNA polymerase sigma factor SigJ n=1 Tax=Catenulispora pinisilvae TaxID=2705253 RepID=UPI001890FFD3|nr:RNA polymerase sigma factor SigJ [Catenulispora pinisilvae]